MEKKARGIFYTPETVAQEIARSTLIAFLTKNQKTNTIPGLVSDYQNDLIVLEKKINEIRVCDNACGLGIFLKKALVVLIEIYTAISKVKTGVTLSDLDLHDRKYQNAKRRQIITQNLFGADISEKAIRKTKLLLCEGLAADQDLDRNFYVGNSIIDDEGFGGGICWKSIPSVPFDVVITNPPYIPTEKMSARERKFFQSNYSVYGKYDTSMIFMEAALDILKPNGILGVIVPQTWQTGPNYKKFRVNLFKRATLVKVTNLPFDVFPDAYIDTGIVILRNQKPREEDRVLTFQYKKNTDITVMKIEDWNEIRMGDILSHPSRCVFTSPIFYSLQRRLFKLGKPLDKLTCSTQGFHAGKFKRQRIITSESCIPFYEKGLANRYVCLPNEQTYVDMKDWLLLKKYYTVPKIFIRRIINRQDRLMAFYVKQPLLMAKDYNPFTIREDCQDIELQYLLALLNSKLLSFLYIEASSVALKDDFRQTTLTELRNLPIAISDSGKQERIVILSEELSNAWTNFERERMQTLDYLESSFRIKSKKKILNLQHWSNEEVMQSFDELNSLEVRKVIEFLDNRRKLLGRSLQKIRMLEKDIDEFVYNLYGLTTSERSMVEDRFGELTRV